MKKLLLLVILSVVGLNIALAEQQHPQWQTYTNSSYGFSLQYPQKLQPTTANFYKAYLLSDTWRALNDDANPSTQSTGKLVVSIPVFRINQDKTTYPEPIKNLAIYPMYYNTEVRVGVSSDPTDVKNCIANSDTTAEINGVIFHVFNLSDNAMMQYLTGKSYRTVHNNQCYAIEQLVTGTKMYNDDTNDVVAANKHVSQQVLDRYTTQAMNILQTFAFTK